MAVEDVSVQQLTLNTLIEKLASITGASVQTTEIADSKTLIYIRVSESALVVPSRPFKTVVIHPFTHGHESELVEIAQNISIETELWITGNDDAGGIGALGIASCIIAESPEYKVYSVLFEDHSLDKAAREKAVHDMRGNTLLLEQHMMVSKDGDVLVRRLVHGGAEVKNVAIPATAMSAVTPGEVTAYFPPALGPYDVEIVAEALGIEASLSSQYPLTVIVGRVKSKGSAVTRDDLNGLVCLACLEIVITLTRFTDSCYCSATPH